MRNVLQSGGFALLMLTSGAVPEAQRVAGTPEVRQLVTFRFAQRLPYGFRPSMEPLLELYREVPAVRRVRGYREAESPESFDLILMTSYRGLDGFDDARQQLSQRRTRSGGTLTSAYAGVDELTEWHRDQFIEMMEDLDYESTTRPEFYVFEWVRLVPAAHRAYELLLGATVLPWERDLNALCSSETARVIVGDGWEYVRILGFSTLGGYQEYLHARRDHAAWEQLALHVQERKTFIVREDESLRVR